MGVTLLNMRFESVRVYMTFCCFYILRALVQAFFIMTRLDGRIWFDPGITAFTVPYDDTDDYYYSGHLGSLVVWGCEYYNQGYRCMTIYCALLVVLMWGFLTLMRVHYFIDLISGVMIAHWFTFHGDWISFFWDVKILGLPHQKRK